MKVERVEAAPLTYAALDAGALFCSGEAYYVKVDAEQAVSLPCGRIDFFLPEEAVQRATVQRSDPGTVEYAVGEGHAMFSDLYPGDTFLWSGLLWLLTKDRVICLEDCLSVHRRDDWSDRSVQVVDAKVVYSP